MIEVNGDESLDSWSECEEIVKVDIHLLILFYNFTAIVKQYMEPCF